MEQPGDTAFGGVATCDQPVGDVAGKGDDPVGGPDFPRAPANRTAAAVRPGCGSAVSGERSAGSECHGAVGGALERHALPDMWHDRQAIARTFQRRQVVNQPVYDHRQDDAARQQRERARKTVRTGSRRSAGNAAAVRSARTATKTARNVRRAASPRRSGSSARRPRQAAPNRPGRHRQSAVVGRRVGHAESGTHIRAFEPIHNSLLPTPAACGRPSVRLTYCR